MPSIADFTVVGDPRRAGATVAQALTERRYTIDWQDEWTGTAKFGSLTGNIMIGVFAPYFKVGIRLMSAAPGQTVVRIEKQASGWAGGLWSALRANKNFTGLVRELEADFAVAGVLVSVRQT